jgi:hypothetical protein
MSEPSQPPGALSREPTLEEMAVVLQAAARTQLETYHPMERRGPQKSKGYNRL